MRHIIGLALCLLSPVTVSGFYTEELPAKFLSVQSIASRYPASVSKYRESIENGYVRIDIVF